MRSSGNNRSTSPAGDDGLLIGACFVALGTLAPVALFQTDLVSRLPDPPFRIFDSERIATSDAAYPLGIPDAVLGLVSFGTTLALIFLARRHGIAKKLLGAKLTLDASAAAFNASRQVISFGKLCSWCTGTSLAAGVMSYAGRDAIRETWADFASVLRG